MRNYNPNKLIRYYPDMAYDYIYDPDLLNDNALAKEEVYWRLFENQPIDSWVSIAWQSKDYVPVEEVLTKKEARLRKIFPKFKDTFVTLDDDVVGQVAWEDTARRNSIITSLLTPQPSKLSFQLDDPDYKYSSPNGKSPSKIQIGDTIRLMVGFDCRDTGYSCRKKIEIDGKIVEQPANVRLPVDANRYAYPMRYTAYSNIYKVDEIKTSIGGITSGVYTRVLCRSQYADVLQNGKSIKKGDIINNYDLDKPISVILKKIFKDDMKMKLRLPKGIDKRYALRDVAHIRAELGKNPEEEIDVMKLLEWMMQVLNQKGKGRDGKPLPQHIMSFQTSLVRQEMPQMGNFFQGWVIGSEQVCSLRAVLGDETVDKGIMEKDCERINSINQSYRGVYRKIFVANKKPENGEEKPPEINWEESGLQQVTANKTANRGTSVEIYNPLLRNEELQKVVHYFEEMGGVPKAAINDVKLVNFNPLFQVGQQLGIWLKKMDYKTLGVVSAVKSKWSKEKGGEIGSISFQTVGNRDNPIFQSFEYDSGVKYNTGRYYSEEL